MKLASEIKELTIFSKIFERPSLSKIKYVEIHTEREEELQELILNEVGEEALLLISRHVTLINGYTFLASTNTRFNIDKLVSKKFTNIVNLKRINDTRWVNKFFESINHKIENGGIYINCVETYTTRKMRILAKSAWPFNYLHYFFDVMTTRVVPKIPVIKKVYFHITKGHSRVLSKAETFGRLYSCGFEIIDEQFIGNCLFFVARKIKEPAYDRNPTYGPIIRLKRLGKGGKLINVYKLRTMHAYSEYLQQYVYDRNNLADGGKFQSDFRITTEGKFFRKFWIDELPMIINLLLKRNMKIVGVRPLSEQYFSLYSEELKQKRIKYTPGLVPPYYVDMPKTLEEIMDSEMRYLESYDKHPFLTDFKYFFKASYNIFIKRARSK